MSTPHTAEKFMRTAEDLEVSFWENMSGPSAATMNGVHGKVREIERTETSHKLF